MTKAADSLPREENEVAALRQEIIRLNKMVNALMDHIERSSMPQHSDFGMFHSALSLEKQVRERTEALEDAIQEKRKINRALKNATIRMEAEIEERHRIEQELRQANAALTRLSFQDSLTGLYNRRYFDEFLAREWLRAKRKQTSIAVILIDVDCFKAYNDSYGHPAGDACLKAVAAALKGTAQRAADTVARYGGEEFAIVLPETATDAALALAEHALQHVEDLAIENRRSSVSHRMRPGVIPHVTVSIGVACTVPQSGVHPAALVATADSGLYQAKQGGRNQIVVSAC